MSVIFGVAQRGGGPYDYSTQIISKMREQDAGILLVDRKTSLTSEQLFLQYSGYEYAKRGAPLWLLPLLISHRKSVGTLGIFFHELFATGPISSSAFWLSPLQQYVVKKLIQICDFWMTTEGQSKDWLRKHGGDSKPHVVIPICSTIGEPSDISHPRRPQVVVFGTQARRRAAYTWGGEGIFEWAAREDHQIVDIGDAIEDAGTAELLVKWGVTRLGRLPAADVSDILQESKFGVVAHRSGALAKSSVFAAYASHGVCPIVISGLKQTADGLIPDIHYHFGPPAFNVQSSDQDMAMRAYTWYKPHGVVAHADAIKELFDSLRVSSRR